MFLHRIILILVFILVLIFNPVYLKVGRYVWNIIHIDILISGSLIKIIILISGLLILILYGIRFFVSKFFSITYQINLFRMSACLFYFIVIIGIFTIIRYKNIGREIDLKVVGEYFMNSCRDINEISGTWPFLIINYILIGFMFLLILIFFLKIIRQIYDYIYLSFLSLHYWLIAKSLNYYLFTGYCHFNLQNIDHNILFFASNISFKFPLSIMLKVRGIIYKFPFIFFKYLPFVLFIYCTIIDCLLNNFVIYHWFHVVPFLVFYLLIYKLVLFFRRNNLFLEQEIRRT